MSGPGIKILVDVGVSEKVESYLQKRGYDVKAVRSIGPRMKDSEIIKIAIAENRMLITMDKDFGELVYHCGQKHSGVLLLRMEDARGEEKKQAVSQILSEYGPAIKGAFCVYKDGRLRIRKSG
jgi:predicted nuclease of predicted toxin-antitoxin system